MITQIEAWPKFLAFTSDGACSGRSSLCAEELPADESGSKRPIDVFIHGIGASSAGFVPWLKIAAGQGHLAFAPDLPGYGDAAANLREDSPTALAYASATWKAVDCWLESAMAERSVEVHLLGHSLGALVATAMASMQPARVSQLTLLCPAGGFLKAPLVTREQARMGRLAPLLTSTMKQIAQQRAHVLVAPGSESAIVDAVAWDMAQVPERTYRQAIEVLDSGDLESLAQQWIDSGGRFKTRVIATELDQVTPVKSCQRIANQLEVKLEVVAGLGHMPVIESPDRSWLLINQGQ